MLLITFACTYVTIPVCASSLDIYEQVEFYDPIEHEEIYNLLDELCLLSARDKFDQYLSTKGISETNNSDLLHLKREKKRNYIIKELREKGVRMYNPNSVKDQKLINELQNVEYVSKYETNSNNVYQQAPDLHVLATAYSVYITDAVYTYDSQKYNYRCITVVDDKGGEALTKNEEIEALSGKKYTGDILRQILEFNFKYSVNKVVSNVVSKLVPQGSAPLIWFLSNVFDYFSNNNNDSINVITRTTNPIYRICNTSVTRMNYYYIFYNGAWRFAGVGGRASIVRGHLFTGNVNGKPVQELVKDEFILKTDNGLRDYYEFYLKNGYSYVDRLGSIEITVPYGSGKNDYRVYYFEPQFYELPGFIV